MYNYFFSHKPLASNSDKEVEQFLNKEIWYTTSNILNKEKVLSSILLSKNYISNKNGMEYYCTDKIILNLLKENNLLISSSFKSILRTGLPFKYSKEIILKMFNIDKIDDNNNNSVFESYIIRFKSIFKNIENCEFGEYVPYLNYYDTFEENLPFHYLVSDGVNIIKELLWMLNTVVLNIEFCPMLIKLISLTVLFLSKEETFAVIKNIIVMDYIEYKDSNIRFRLCFDFEHNKKLVKSFIESYKEITNSGMQMLEKFHSINFKLELLIEDMFFNLFIDYFNFQLLHRVFFLYLNEGVKILYRVAYAVLKTLKQDIMNLKKQDSNEVIAFIKLKCNEITEYNTFVNLALGYKLTKYNNRYKEVVINEVYTNANLNLYIPFIKGKSDIMSNKEILSIWSVLPKSLKISNANIVFQIDNSRNSGCLVTNIRDSIKSNSKEGSKECSKDFKKECNKNEINKDYSKEYSKENTKDYSKECSKEFNNEIKMVCSKECIKEDPINDTNIKKCIKYNSKSNLEILYDVCMDEFNIQFNMFIIIETIDNDVFGVIMSSLTNLIQDTYDPGYISLFTLRPNIKNFTRNMELIKNYNDKTFYKIVTFTKEEFVIGYKENIENSEKSNIKIDSNIKSGTSFANQLFENAVLTRKESFDILKLEVFILN